MADNATLARSLYDAWNERNFDYLTEVVAPDAKIVIVGSGDTFEGPEGALDYNKMWADAFPDGRITIDSVVPAGGGNIMAVEYTGRGTHTGDMVTSAGTIPATGRSVTIQLCDVLEFVDGKVMSQRTYFDTGSLMAQLGMTAEQTATTTQ